MSKGGVEWSEDLERILALPRRAKPDLVALATGMTAFLKKPGGTQTLRGIQAWALAEMVQCNGLLAPISVGGGKCVRFDTEVYDAGAGRRRRVDESGAFTTVAKNAEGKLELARTVAAPSGSKECVTLLLADGSEVTLSTDHPVFTQRGWVQAALLGADDLVAVPRRLPAPARLLSIRDDELKLLAYVLADGNCTSGTLMFSDENAAVIEEVCALSAKLADASQNLAAGGGAMGCHLEEGPRERKQASKAREFALRGLSWFKRKWALNDLSKDKRLPAELYGLPDRQVALFLNRFLACDGHVSLKGVEVTLASEKFVEDLRFLFLRLGVMSRKNYKLAHCDGKEFDAWRLTVTGTNVDRLLEQVGDVFGSERRCWKLRSVRARTATNTNVDVVPVGLAEHARMCEELGWPGRGQTGVRGDRTGLRKALAVTSGQLVSREKFAAACEHYHYRGSLHWLAHSDLAWEHIKSVSAAGAHPVHDLSVPGFGNFVAGNVVVHNTLLGLLAPMVMPDCKRAVLFVPPSLRAQLLLRDWDFYDKHWKLPNLAGGKWFTPGRPVLHVVAYSELSSPKNTVLLEQIQPDLVLGDEIHRIRGATTTSRGRRFIKYFADHPETRFCGWSGTITSKSLTDYAHLLQIALDLGSPVPLDSSEVDSWAMALDPNEYHYGAGELRRLCLPGEHVRSGFRRRLVDTPGVVASGESELGTSLVFYERKAPPVPDSIQECLRKLRRSPEMGGWKRPDDEELPDIMAVASCARQLAQGLYLKWRFPRNEPLPIRQWWFDRRQDFNRELREKLKHPAPYLDSPNYCVRAAIRWYEGGCSVCHRKAEEPHAEGCSGADSRPLWPSYCWPAWHEAKDTVVHETEVVWVDEYLMHDAAAWAKKKPGIVWVEHPAVGEKVAKLSGLPYFGGGDKASVDILKEDGKRSIICSSRARSEGLNLQTAFSRNLVIAFPADAGLVEQVVGRTHRPGQPEDEVEVDYYAHTVEMSDARDKARRRAEYVQATTGSAQKLVYGSWTVRAEEWTESLVQLPKRGER